MGIKGLLVRTTWASTHLPGRNCLTCDRPGWREGVRLPGEGLARGSPLLAGSRPVILLPAWELGKPQVSYVTLRLEGRKREQTPDAAWKGEQGVNAPGEGRWEQTALPKAGV